MEHDPITVAERLRWSAAHWREDNTQPRDLDRLLIRAAETLDRTVPSIWRVFAIILALGVIVIAAAGVFRP